VTNLRAGCRFFPFLAVCFLSWPVAARGDMIPGVDLYMRNAAVVLRVRAATVDESNVDPAPNDHQRLEVQEVLKGIFAPASLCWRRDTLAPGQEAIVLLPHKYPARADLATRVDFTVDPREQGEKLLWPISDRIVVDTGRVPRYTTGGSNFGLGEITVESIRRAIGQIAPEEVGLHSLVIAALFEPREFVSLEDADPDRARYVASILTIRDLKRDIVFIAGNLECFDLQIAYEAERVLRKLTAGAREIRPRIAQLPSSSTASERRALAEKWIAWWQEHRARLRWDDTTASYVPRGEDDPYPRLWPSVPEIGAPRSEFPPALLAAIEQDDLQQFAATFRTWLDSGALRDRSIGASRFTIDDHLAKRAFNAAIDGGSYIPPAPRLPPWMLFDRERSVGDRMKLIALVAQSWHFDRFAAERAAAIDYLANTRNLDDVRRAAYWELRGEYLKTPGQVACLRLAGEGDSQCQSLLARLFLTHIDDTILTAARTAIRAQRAVFVQALLDSVRDRRDVPAQWAGRLLCQEKEARVIPLLLNWLKDENAESRSASAINLTWLPKEEFVVALLKAIAVEKNTETKGQMIVAVAQTGDPRGLEPLIAGVHQDLGAATCLEIARGLTRIGDTAALPALADLAKMGKETADLQLQMESVSGFGRVSGRFDAPPPIDFWSSRGIDHSLIEKGHVDIEKWRSESKKD